MLAGRHTPVICTSDIPAPTLDYFLQCVEEDLQERIGSQIYGNEKSTVADVVAFITSKDVEAITSGPTRPATAFDSPFLGESIEQLRDWFIANIRVIDSAFTDHSFLVLDSRTVKDNTCLLVSILYDEFRTLRCDFKAGRRQVYSIEYGYDSFMDGIRDLFLETGEIMTTEKFVLALNHRLHVEDGELKTKEKDEEEEDDDDEE